MIDHEEVIVEIERMLDLLRKMPDSSYFYGIAEGTLYTFAMCEAISEQEYESYFEQANQIFSGQIDNEIAQLSLLTTIVAKQTIDGIPVDPVLPEGFDNTPNDQRPLEHHQWINRPYIETTTLEQLTEFWREQQNKDEDEILEATQKWLVAYPEGLCYTVCCLDGLNWNCPSEWGYFKTLDEALTRAKQSKDHPAE